MKYNPVWYKWKHWVFLNPHLLKNILYVKSVCQIKGIPKPSLKCAVYFNPSR